MPAVAGIGFPTDVGELPLTDVAGGGVPGRCWGGGGGGGKPLLAVAEVDPLIAVEMSSSTDLRGPAGSSGVYTHGVIVTVGVKSR